MPSDSASFSSRDVAFYVLDLYRRTSNFTAKPLTEAAAASGLSGAERRLAVEMVYGVVRRQATLNALLEPHVRRPRHRVEGSLWTLLQLGAYQLGFLDAVPDHAAVHETVQLAKKHGKPRWVGFLNGILRALAADLTDEFTDRPARDAVPLEAGRYRCCRTPVFPDPSSDPCGYFAQAFSFPAWLAERWQDRFEWTELLRIGFWFNAPAPLCLRVNTLRTTRETLLDSLACAGVDARPSELPEAVRLPGTASVEDLPGFAAGWFTVQDESAMHAARLLDPRPDETVLDLCAAPGTKTTHLAELMHNRGRIVAADIHVDRLASLTEATRRLGVENVETRLIRPDGSDLPAGPFDRVLVDAPCSNTGVLGKRPEVRWRIKPRDIQELAALQRRLLASACDHLKPGGRVVYSTCSIEPEENGEVVRAVLQQRPELVLESERAHIPGRPADGGYLACALRTTGGTG